ncbi:hypothetical protein F4861DRAFT_536028 [Xylaria intraflava]|nr:hypothetical protein F4861DRAFT_536028 [Xylaria intraflava]
MHAWGRRSQRTIECHLLGMMLKFLGACQLLRQSWTFTKSGLPLPPTLAAQLDELACEGVVEPICLFLCELAEQVYLREDFFLFLATFVLLHNIDLTIAHYSLMSSPGDHYSDKIQQLRIGAETLLHCFHGQCLEHRAIAPDWEDMMRNRSNSLDGQEMSYLRGVVKFTAKPMIQAQLRAAQKSSACDDGGSYLAIQVFQTNWKPF